MPTSGGNSLKATKVNNTTIQLEFDNNEQRQSIAKQLSYDIPGAKFSVAYKLKKWGGKKCFLTQADRIKLGFFKTLFPSHSIVCDKDFHDVGFELIELYANNRTYERRQYQLDAINTIFREKIGIINCIMGSGKTMIAAGVCSYHLSLNSKNKVLFIVYDKNILQQSVKNFTNYGFKVSQFGDNVKDLSGDIVVATIQSLNNIEKPKEVLKNVSFCFLDEAHHGKSKTSRKMIAKLPNCQYFIGLTATPHIKKSLETAELTSICGPVIFEYGFTEAIRDNRIAPVKAFFLDLPINYDLKEEFFGRKNYKLIWDSLIKDNIERNDNIALILKYCVELLETPNLVLVDRIEHGAELYNSIKKFPNLTATTMYGCDDILMRTFKKNALQADTTNVLISTVVSEGIDFKVSPVVAINASGRKSFIKLIQFLGRITRPNEKFKTFRCYIDFVDKEHGFLLRHSKERIEVCKEFGIDVQVCSSVKELMIEVIKHYKECISIK